MKSGVSSIPIVASVGVMVVGIGGRLHCLVRLLLRNGNQHPLFYPFPPWQWASSYPVVL